MVFAFFGPTFTHVLYDDRYKNAGWMLQLLGLGWLVGCLASSYGGVLLARGSANLNTLLLACQVIIQVLSVYAGYYLAGTEGLVCGYAAAFWFMYPINAVLFHRIGLWQPAIDLPLVGLSVLIVFVVWNFYVFI